MQYPRYCTGRNSFNISHGFNLMLRKLTRHISTLAIRVVQFLSYLFFSHFSSSAFPNLNFKKFKKIISLGDCKSMAESPWASALPTPPPPLPPPVMLPGLVFSFFKVFLQLSLFSLHPHHGHWRAYYRCHHHWWLPGLPSIPLKFIFSFIFLFVSVLIILMTKAI